MRVLEADPSVLYKMGKNKKHKIRKAKDNDADDSSEDGALNGCPHVSKAVNLAAMRKVLLKPTVTYGECTGCSKEPPKATGRDKDLFGSVIEGPVAATAGEDVESVEMTICICLQCGHQGCDRNSPNKHALKHFRTPHSGLHSIIINLTTWSTWCYMCDEEVPMGGKIKACIDFLQKQAGIAKPDGAQASGRPVESPVTELSSPLPNTTGSKNVASVSCIKVKGLSNLGNTCFFNAVMQSMCQTRGLETILSERSKHGTVSSIPGLDLCFESDSSGSDDDQDEEATSKKKALPSIQTNLGDVGQVTLALLNFVQEMKGSTTRNGIVNPTPLFTQVCKKAPRFKGFQQQDSHELLRYLVDCIRTEEIKRGQASILKFFRLPEAINPKKVDEETKMKVKEYGRQVKHTFLDSLFGGQLVSTVKCEECKSVSQIFEAFLDLSLPVMEEKPQRPNLVLIGKKKDQVLMSGEGVADEAGGGATGGPDLDAYAERPSKYQERKNKRLAKKDSKRKSKFQKSKSLETNESGGKADKDEKVGPDSEGASDGNKTGNEKEATSPDNPVGGESLSSGRHIRIGLTPHSSNTSVESGVDNQRDCGKRIAKSADHEETDDPSDADVEDNLESDMSRVGSTISACPTFQRQSALTNGDNTLAEVARESTPSDPSLTTSEPSLSNSHVSNSFNISTTASLSEVKEESAAPLIVFNGDAGSEKERSGANVEPLSSETHKSIADSEKSLCEDLSRVSLTESQLSGVDGASISCEISVNNSSEPAQVLHLANGLGRLTVHNSDTTEKDSGLALSEKSGGISPRASDGYATAEKLEGDDDDDSQCQVSATFTLTLPSAADSNNHMAESSAVKEEAGSTSPRAEVRYGVKCIEKTTEIGAPSSPEGKPSPINHQNILKAQQKYLKEARSFSMNTLAPRYHPSPKECSILSCLNQFTAAELLTGSNKFGCKECTKRRRRNSQVIKGDKKTKDTVYSNANKQYLIFRPPSVLTLHLKRFEQTGLTSRKVNRHVDFPLLLDLAPYCSSLCLGVKESQSRVLYSLYAVVEHSGRLSGGHYTAYIKVRPGLASHTQFLHTQPPSCTDLLNVYLERILKSREYSCLITSHQKEEECGNKPESRSPVDKEMEARAESLLPPGRWFHVSDSRVNEVTEAVVLKAQAYLLFYERIF